VYRARVSVEVNRVTYRQFDIVLTSRDMYQTRLNALKHNRHAWLTDSVVRGHFDRTVAYCTLTTHSIDHPTRSVDKCLHWPAYTRHYANNVDNVDWVDISTYRILSRLGIAARLIHTRWRRNNKTFTTRTMVKPIN